MDIHKVRVITFDLDDTLWAIAPVLVRAEDAMWAWLAEHHPQFAAIHDRQTLAAERREVEQKHSDLVHDLTALRMLTLEQAARHAGYSAPAAQTLAQDAFAVLWAVRNEVTLFDDVLPALRTLSQTYSLGAITNGNANLRDIGLAEFFAFIVVAREVGWAKPDQRIFDQARCLAGVAASELLHVGDHIEHDMRGAKSAGWQTAWVNRPGMGQTRGVESADWIDIEVSDLAALSELFAGDAVPGRG